MLVVIEAIKADGSRLITDPCELTYPELSDAQFALAQEGFTQISTHRLDMVCDFCNEPGIVRVFQIAPGGIIGRMITDTHDATHLDEDGKWGACKVCAGLITAGERAGLRSRALSRVPDYMREVAAPIVDGPHGCFWRGYVEGNLGEPVISDAELMGGQS